MAFKEKILEVKDLLNQVNELLAAQKTALDATSESIKNYAKNAKVPSDFTNAQKQIKDQETVRAELQKSLDANAAAISKKQAQMNATFAAAEAQRAKDLASQQAKTAKEIALYEKAAQKEIELNNKRVASEQKKAERLVEIEQNKAAKIIAANEKLAAKLAAIDAKNSRTGASSPIPGIGNKISDFKETERLALANEKLNRAYVQLNMQRTAAKNKLQDLIASEQAANKEIRIAQKEFDVLDKRIQKANHAVGNFSSSVGNYKNALSGIGNLMGAFGISTGLYLGASIIKDIYETTKQLQSLDLALKMVSDTQENYASNTSFIRDISQKWGIEIKGLTEQFTQFYVNAKGKISDTDIKTTFEGIAKAGSLMGISIDKQNDAFYAFNQMLSKGTVQAEELKKQLGNALPGAIKAATMAYQELNPHLKVTEQIMLDEMKAGNLISNEMVPAIIRAYQKLYGIEMVKSVDTLAAAQNRLSNSWTEMVDNMTNSKNEGALSFLGGILSSLTFLTKEVGRFLASWDMLYEKAKLKGAKSGIEKFREDISQATTKEGADTIASFERKNAVEGIARNMSDIEQIDARLAELDKVSVGNLTKALFGIHLYKTRKLKLQREIALENKAFYESLYKETTKYMKGQYFDDGTSPPGGAGGNTESEAARKKRLADAKKAVKELAQIEEQRLKDVYNLEVSNIQRKIEIAKDEYQIVSELHKNEIGYTEGGVAKKMALSMKLATFELELAQRVAKEKKRLAQGNAALGVAPIIGGNTVAQNEYNTEAENVAQSHVDRMDKINKDYFKAMEEAVPKDWSSKTPTMWTKEQIKQAEEDQKKIKEIQDKIKDDIVKYIESFQKTFAGDLGLEKTFDMFVKLQENGKTMWQNINDLAEGSKEKQIAIFEAISESAQEAFNFMSQASQENFDAEYDRLERQKEDALRFAGESESGRAEIERQYERKRQQIARREAKAKKDTALFNIFVDTAQAVAAFLAKGQWGQAIAAGILGGIQYAMVSSKDVPNYFTGTDSAPEGVAWTQERGQEIITDKHGKVKDMGDNKGPRLTYLKQGDKVIKNRETLDILSFNRSYANLMDSTGISSPVINIESSGINSERFDEGISRLEKVIKDKPSFQLIDDERGRRLYREYRGERTQLMNDRQNIISRDV